MSAHEGLLDRAEGALGAWQLAQAAVLFREAQRRASCALPAASVGMARIALCLGRPGDAVALLDTVFPVDPRSAPALTLKGLATEQLGHADEALRLHHQAVAAAPGFAPAWFNLGRALCRAARWAEGSTALTRAYELDPAPEELSTTLAVALHRCGRPADAIVVMVRAVAAHPRSVGPVLLLADLLTETGRAPEADRLLENAQRRAPENPIFPARRVALALRRGDIGASQRHLDGQLRLAPSDTEAWLLRATLCLRSLDVSGAIDAALEARRLAPRDWRPLHVLGTAARLLRRTATAESALRSATQLAPDAWVPANELALLLLEESDRVDEAVDLLGRAVTTAPSDARAAPLFNLALAHARAGRSSQASETAARVLELAPRDGPLAQETRRFLEHRTG